MKGKRHFCAVVGCDGEAVDKHHIGGPSSPMIWVCKECHGRIHGVTWTSEHGALTRAGLAKAKAAGRVGGNPRARNPDFIKEITAIRRQKYREGILDKLKQWLPIVVELRPTSRWPDVARVVTERTGDKWTSDRLRRAMKLLIAEGIVAEHVMGNAPARQNDRVAGYLVPLIAALAPGKTLMQIAAELERIGERTVRGGTRWHPSSVAYLLKKSPHTRH